MSGFENGWDIPGVLPLGTQIQTPSGPVALNPPMMGSTPIGYGDFGWNLKHPSFNLPADDGVADCTTAILAWAAKAPGLLIAPKPATAYRFTGSITFPDFTFAQGVGYATNTGAAQRKGSVFLKDGNFDGFIIGSGSVFDGFHVSGASGNGGDGVYVKSGRTVLRNFSSMDHGGDGIRIGGKTGGLNCNAWRLYNVLTKGNTGAGVNIRDSGGVPNANAGICDGLDSQSNTGDGLYIDASIDCQWFNVNCSSNTGWGIRLHVGAGAPKGHSFWFPYLEANTAGAGTFELGAVQNLVWGTRQGTSDGWVDSDTTGTNLVLGRATSKSNDWYLKGSFAVQLLRISDAAVTGTWRIIQNAGDRALEIHGETSATPLDFRLLHDQSGLVRLITMAASATGGAGLRIPHGTLPNSPTDGDVWSTTAGLFTRINGVTKTVTLT